MVWPAAIPAVQALLAPWPKHHCSHFGGLHCWQRDLSAYRAQLWNFFIGTVRLVSGFCPPKIQHPNILLDWNRGLTLTPAKPLGNPALQQHSRPTQTNIAISFLNCGFISPNNKPRIFETYHIEFFPILRLLFSYYSEAPFGIFFLVFFL